MKIKTNSMQMLPTFDYTITVLNKLRAQDSATKQDVWVKTVIHNCSWSSDMIRNIAGTKVDVGASYIARVPKNNRYRKYKQWKENISDFFTFSLGDYIIKGEVTEDIINAQNIQRVVQAYRPDAFEIRAFKDNTGTVELMEHYRIEGV